MYLLCNRLRHKFYEFSAEFLFYLFLLLILQRFWLQYYIKNKKFGEIFCKYVLQRPNNSMLKSQWRQYLIRKFIKKRIVCCTFLQDFANELFSEYSSTYPKGPKSRSRGHSEIYLGPLPYSLVQSLIDVFDI